MKKNGWLFLILAMFLVNAQPVVMAAETSVSVRAGGIHSDNVRRTSTAEESETVALVGLDLTWREEEGRLTGDVNASLNFHSYLDDTFDDENYSTAFAQLEFRLVPDRVSWILEDHFGRIIADPYRADTPQNRENINTFSTGPNIEFQFGPRTAIILQGRFVSNAFETSDVDNTVKNGTIAFVRQISPTRAVSFNVTGARVEFDSALIENDFDRQSAYLGIESRTARGNLSLKLGVNEIHDRGDTREGLLSEISWTRELSGMSSFTARFNQRYSEAGELFSLYQGSGRDFNASQDISAIGEPLENQRFELTYNYRKEGNETYVSAIWNDDDFEYTNSYDRQRKGIGAGLSRAIREDWRAGIDVRFEQHDFEDTGSSFDEVVARLLITRSLSPKLEINAGYERFRREGDVVITGYTENRYSVFFTYRPER